MQHQLGVMVDRLLVVVAHPDDESFGTGSVIAVLAGRGVQVTVCCATRGEAGQAPGSVNQDLGAVREAELRAAGAILGVHDFVLLGFADSGMSGGPDPASLAGADFGLVVASVRTVVERVRPDVVVTLDPDHGDGHRDHERIGRATIQACRGLSGVRVYGWVLSRPLLARWFQELEHLRPASEHLDLDRERLGCNDDDVTAMLDGRGVRDIRALAIAAHASQTSPYDGMPADLLDAFLSADRLIRHQPAFDGTVEYDLFT